MILRGGPGKNKMLFTGIVLFLISAACFLVFFHNCEGTSCLSYIWLGIGVYGVLFFSVGLIFFSLISRIKNIWLKVLFIAIAAIIVIWALFKFYA
jgi:hypothetical protein